MARKASMWAKAAGEYYRKNKGKNGIESFSDVLESPEFKSEYYAKYGKQGKQRKTMGKKDRKVKGMRNTRRYRGGEGEGEMNGGVSQQSPGESTTAPPSLPMSADPIPSATTSSLSAAPLPPSNPQVVTGGKRKGKGKSSKKRTAKKSSYNLW
jgi:hypothetical protein